MLRGAKAFMAETILDKLAKRIPLSLKDEESQLANKVKRALSNIKYRQRSNKKLPEKRGGLYSMGARGVFVKECGIYHRRVIVKTKIVKNQSPSFRTKLNNYLKYITRADAALDKKTPEVFAASERLDTLKNIEERFSQAPHNFRFIISPEDGDQIDLKEFTRNLLTTMERDLCAKLDWVAAVHYDTNEPHVHLLVNGHDLNGQKLLMTRDYIAHGMRNRAGEIVTNKLGLREYDEIVKKLLLEVNREKKCFIDEVIKKSLDENKNKISIHNISRSSLSDLPIKLVHARLTYLESKGFARREHEGSWHIQEDYLEHLRELNRIQSIVERIKTALNVEKERCNVVGRQTLLAKNIEGHVIRRGYIDEISDREFLIVKSNDENHHYVELEKYSEKIVAQVGEKVRIECTKAFSGPKVSDRTINKEAKENGGIYDAKVHEERAKISTYLPPGVSPQAYVQVHVNRLKVLARRDLIKDLGDGCYEIPKDYLEKISAEAQLSEKHFIPHIKVTRLALTNSDGLKQIKGLKPC